MGLSFFITFFLFRKEPFNLHRGKGITDVRYKKQEWEKKQFWDKKNVGICSLIIQATPLYK